MRDHRIKPKSRVRLDRIDPDDTGKLRDEDAARAKLIRDHERLPVLQDRFYAEHKHGMLIVLQGMDTAGKDGTIKHVMSGVNPSGCEVAPFKVPTEEEAAHDFLWRAHKYAPRKGHITIFNRSHYEDVLVPNVHGLMSKRDLAPRYDQINAFERILVDNGTVVVKFFLHISKDEQRRRLRERLDDPNKHWKFSAGDLRERKLWDRYQRAYEELLSRCSTKHAPWYVVPANKKWYRNLVIAKVLVETLKDLNPQYPPPTLSPEEMSKVRF